jgi:hypothetical protein
MHWPQAGRLRQQGEELTLYLIELKKENEELRNEIYK